MHKNCAGYGLSNRSFYTIMISVQVNECDWKVEHIFSLNLPWRNTSPDLTRLIVRRYPEHHKVICITPFSAASC